MSEIIFLVNLSSVSATKWFASGDVVETGETSPAATTRSKISSTSKFAVGVVIETGVTNDSSSFGFVSGSSLGVGD